MSADFDKLIAGAKSGDQNAIEQLVKKYEADVRMVARMNLGPALRSHFDSVDLLQSVHHSILVGLKNKKFDISTPQKLIGLATTIVRRKIARKWRKLKRQKPTGSLSASEFSDVFSALVTPADQQEQANVQEELERMFERLSQQEQQLISMRIEGFSTIEAAREMDVDPDVLRVRLSRLRKKLIQLGFFADWL